MTPERIKELREHFEYEHPVNECIDEIEQLRAALKQIANDGLSGGMGGGLRRDDVDLRDIARAALEAE